MPGYRSRTCGERHDELPPRCGFHAPSLRYGVLEAGRQGRCLLSSDHCIVDEEHHSVVGNLESPIIGTDGRFSSDVRVSLSDRGFDPACDLWEQPGRESEPPYFGRLSGSVPGDPETLDLEAMVHTRPVGTRPRIELEPTDRPLAIEQRDGINWGRVRQIAESVRHGGG